MYHVDERSAEGWAWRTYTKASHPHFWVPIDASKFRYRAMYEEIEMPWDWPVEVNHLEAVAYWYVILSTMGLPECI